MQQSIQARLKVHYSNITVGKANTSSINTLNDSDEFHGNFSILSNGIITITVKRISSGSALNYRVQLLSQDGKEEYLYGLEKGENVVYKIPVKVGKYKVIGNGTYKSQYTVNFTKSNEDEMENNDTMESANSISINKEYKGIANEGHFIDQDFF